MAIPQRDGRQSGKVAIVTGAARTLAGDEARFPHAADLPVDHGRAQGDHD